MAKVVAIRDIVTEKKFRIARAGDRGKALRGVCPHAKSNFGKVLVFFNKRKHGYWVWPDSLQFISGLDGLEPEDFIAREPEPPKPPPVPQLPSKELDVSYHFGNNLRLFRRVRKLSQIQLSERMNVAQSAVSYRERQEKCPNGDFIDAASDALELPAFMFFVPLDNCSWFDEARKFLSQLSSEICEVQHARIHE